MGSERRMYRGPGSQTWNLNLKVSARTCHSGLWISHRGVFAATSLYPLKCVRYTIALMPVGSPSALRSTKSTMSWTSVTSTAMR